jgi:ATP-dependent 26S proteasome regulatory subunit
MVHSKIPTHPIANQNRDKLPPLMSQAHSSSSSSSSDFSIMRDKTQTKLNSINESSKKLSAYQEIKPQLMSNFDFEPQIQGYFIEPIEQSETIIPVKKEEKIVISTSETDALYN